MLNVGDGGGDQNFSGWPEGGEGGGRIWNNIGQWL